MKTDKTSQAVARVVAAIVALIIVLIPFHAFLTVWGSSAVGHYTALRLWKEALMLVALLGAVYLIMKQPALRRQLAGSWLWRLIGLYIVVNLLWAVVARLHGAVTTKAVLYGGLVDLRPFVMLLIAWVAASYVPKLLHYWQRLVLYPAAVVVAIGLLQQFVLPYDVMKHFGYGPNTIGPYETIDHKTSYIRIRSTLRGANLLGGYLIIALSALLQRILMGRRRWLTGITLAAGLVVLYGSGSRGAWLGALAAVAFLLWLSLPSRRAKRLAVFIGAGLVLVLAGSVLALRHNDFVENTVFHTDEHSSSQVSSNAAHLSASRDAFVQVIHEPLGRGPGTAGPAGEYNTGHPVRIAENYFLQVGQETGWLGLVTFVAAYLLLAAEMWQRRSHGLAQVLIASQIGLTIMAMLMHIWTDDTIAYLWFGLAGIALAIPANNRGVKSREKSAGANV
jgi:hypothetical protein